MKALLPLRNDIFFPLEQSFEKFYRDFFSNKTNLDVIKGSSGYPKVNVYMDNKKFKMLFSVPGVAREDLEVEMDGSTVTVKGKMSSKYCSDQDSQYLVRELRQSYFTRTLQVPPEAVGEPEAELVDGILTLSWDTALEDESTVKKIAIK